MKKILSFIGIVCVFIITTGCPKPNIAEYEFLNAKEKDSLAILAFDPVIQRNDILYINISISGSEAVQKLTMPFNQTSETTGGNASLLGYLVSPKGTIDMPEIGVLEVAGKSKTAVINLIREKIRDNFEVNPRITLRILNYTVYINGEVGSPGAIDVKNEVLTLPQAITIARGFTVYASRGDVQIIREQPDGSKIIKNVDLRYDDLLAKDSEFFYLKQNDYINIKANKDKILSSNQTTARTITYATTAITILATLFTIFSR